MSWSLSSSNQEAGHPAVELEEDNKDRHPAVELGGEEEDDKDRVHQIPQLMKTTKNKG